jgi:signal transduction histidine kinase
VISVRRRLLRDSLVAAVIASLVLGVSLALLVDRFTRQQTTDGLRREAETLAAALDPSLEAGTLNLAEIRKFVPPNDRIEVKLADGTVLRSDPQDEEDRFSVTVPASNGVSLTLSAPIGEQSTSTGKAVGAFAGVALLSLFGAMALAAVQARRLTAPLRELTKSADRLAMGDFSVRSPRTDLTEFDRLGTALDDGSRRIAELVTAERAFTSRARHQLRTPLTAMMVRLEDLMEFNDPEVSTEAKAILGQAKRLSSTIDELVHLGRTGKAGRGIDLNLRSLVALHVDDWRPRYVAQRRFVRLLPGSPVAAHVTPGVIGQLVDVLLDNALKHGGGMVSVSVSVNTSMAQVDVTDEGPGIALETLETLFASSSTPNSEHGIGLPLMRELMEAEGGSLHVARNHPFQIRCAIPLGSVTPTDVKQNPTSGQ